MAPLIHFTYNAAAVAGIADSQSLNISNLTGGTFTADGIESLTINSSLAKSTLAAVASNKLTSVTFTGDQDVTVSGAIDFVAGTNDDTTIDATIDASAFTGKLNVTADTNDTKITGGSGDDTINMVGLLTKNDVVDGGAGTDTLTLIKRPSPQNLPVSATLKLSSSTLMTLLPLLHTTFLSFRLV